MAKPTKKAAKKRRTAKKDKPVEAPKPQREVDLRTDERRIRVLQLYGKKAMHIAKILLEEGFDVNCGERPLTPEKVQEWERRRLDSMRRNVDNDKEYWKGRFREKAKAPRTSEDLGVEREEYIASLMTDLDDLDDILADKNTKSTAKAILIGEKRQTRQAIAKAKGIEQAVEFDPEGESKPQRSTVLVLDLSNCSDDYKAKVLKDAAPREG